ncbi:hypothetical protein ACLKA7_000145 [Drosophila subpalustris]
MDASVLQSSTAVAATLLLLRVAIVVVDGFATAIAQAKAIAARMPKVLWKRPIWASSALWPAAAVRQVHPYAPGTAAAVATRMTAKMTNKAAATAAAGI